MMKRIKLLSLISLSILNLNLGATNDPMGYAQKLLKNPKELYAFAAAIVLGNVAHGMAQREYDDKGTYRTIGTSEVGPLIEEVAYCFAAGTGITAIEHSLTGTGDLTLRAGIEAAISNAISLMCTNWVAEQDMYKSLNRNHPLLRGWLPFNTKYDDSVKKATVFSLVRSAINIVKKTVNTPSIAS